MKASKSEEIQKIFLNFQSKLEKNYMKFFENVRVYFQ